jgi:hypothetical protein
MNSTEVYAHYREALAAEQAWLANDQELLEMRQALPVGSDYVRRVPEGNALKYRYTAELRIPLFSHCLVEEMLEDIDPEGSTRSNTLRGAVAQRALDHIAPRDDTRAQLSLHKERDVSSACQDTENTFAHGIRQVLELPNTNSISARRRQQTRMSVYHASGRPILLRKDVFESTALLLEPVYLEAPGIDRLVLPRGIVAGITTSPGTAKAMMSGAAEGPEGPNGVDFETYEIDPSSLGINPHRLSAWTHDNPLDRALFSLMGYGSKPIFHANKWEIYGDIEPGHIDQAAQRIMELCGVAA